MLPPDKDPFGFWVGRNEKRRSFRDDFIGVEWPGTLSVRIRGSFSDSNKCDDLFSCGIRRES